MPVQKWIQENDLVQIPLLKEPKAVTGCWLLFHIQLQRLRHLYHVFGVVLKNSLWCLWQWTGVIAEMCRATSSLAKSQPDCKHQGNDVAAKLLRSTAETSSLLGFKAFPSRPQTKVAKNILREQHVGYWEPSSAGGRGSEQCGSEGEEQQEKETAVQVFPPEHHGHEQALHPHCITKAGVVLHQNQRRTGQFSDFWLCIAKISQELLQNFTYKPMKHDPQWFHGISSIVRENYTKKVFWRDSVIITEFKVKAEK